MFVLTQVVAVPTEPLKGLVLTPNTFNLHRLFFLNFLLQLVKQLNIITDVYF